MSQVITTDDLKAFLKKVDEEYAAWMPSPKSLLKSLISFIEEGKL